MASYLNRKNESIEVSEEHIETAIELKLELQKQSPSGRCSWARHRRMMIEEGFEDSSTNENYRQMIKQQQNKRGQLPKVEEYADMVSEKKLESVRNALGEMYIAKRGTQNANRELNKVKRQLADNMMFIEDSLNELSGISFDRSYSELEWLDGESDDALFAIISDWHIGLMQDSYNYEIANQRIKRYAEKIIKDAKLRNINRVSVANVGDAVEGAYLRSTQAYDLEFDYSTQVVKATEAIVNFLFMLSEELNVEYLGGILGNHSRMYDKGKTLDGDSAENIIDAFVKHSINQSNNDRIVVNDCKDTNYAINATVGGKRFKLVHGDLMGKSGKEKVSKFISSDNEFYDALVYGHYHSSVYAEENHNRMSIGVGCLQGTTNFSKQLGYDTFPSQTLIIIEDGMIFPKRIELK